MAPTTSVLDRDLVRGVKTKQGPGSLEGSKGRSAPRSGQAAGPSALTAPAPLTPPTRSRTEVWMVSEDQGRPRITGGRPGPRTWHVLVRLAVAPTAPIWSSQGSEELARIQDHGRSAGEGQHHVLGSRGVAPDGAGARHGGNQVPDRGLDG